jgi:hypothetical protein
VLAENNIYSFQNKNHLSRLAKIYIWSVMIEPLIFFVAFGHFFGISTNISRFIQLFVLIVLFFKLILIKRNWFVPNPMSNNYRWYSIYFLLALFSGFYGVFVGAYNVSFLPNEEALIISFYRPLFEYVVAFYYFFYFVVLARYFIRTPEAVDYFFLIFKWVFFITLYIGLFDLFLMLIIPDYIGIPRHVGDLDVGLRFHSIAGEPRDAFVYLMLGLGILWAKDIWRTEKKLNILLFTIIVLAAMFTQSFSAIIGLIFSAMMLLIYFIPTLPFKRAAMYVSGTTFILTIVILYAVFFSPRIGIYIKELSGLYYILKDGDILSPIARAVINNIYPIWHRWIEVVQFNFIPLFFGTGLGSSSIVNANFMLSNEIFNPNSNLIRNIFESGIVGTFLIIAAFIKPIEHFYISEKVKNRCKFIMIFIVGAFFAHRSSAPFIFLGITSIIFDFKFRSHFFK